MVHILGKVNPVHTLPYYLFKTTFNNIFTYTARSSKWCPFFMFPIKMCRHFYSLPCMPHAPPWSSHPNYIWSGVHKLSSLYSLLQNSVFSSIFGQNVKYKMSKFNEIHSVVSEPQHADQGARLIERSLRIPRTDKMHLAHKFCSNVSTINRFKHGESKHFWCQFIC